MKAGWAPRLVPPVRWAFSFGLKARSLQPPTWKRCCARPWLRSCRRPSDSTLEASQLVGLIVQSLRSSLIRTSLIPSEDALEDLAGSGR